MKNNNKFMKNIFLLLIFIVLFNNDTFSQNGIYGNARWGMSRKDIKKIEYENYLSKSTRKQLLYKHKMDDYYVYVYYNFRKNKLYSISIIVEGNYDGIDVYIDNYEKVNEIFTDKYGKYIYRDIMRHNLSIDNNDKSKYRDYLNNGDMSIITVFSDNISVISNTLTRVNNKLVEIIIFMDVNIIDKL
jgi:hypothetical protein